MAPQRAQDRDWIAVLCVGCIALGWFTLDTLQVSLGRLSRGTRFYELLAALRHPAVLLIGVGDGYDMEVLACSLLCLTVLGAALAAALAKRRPGVLAGVLPLALMVVMGVTLYRSGLRLDAAAPTDSLRADLLRLAQDALQRAQDRFARQVTLGSGAYLSLLACLLLAMRSLARVRAAHAVAASELPSG